MFGFSAVQDRTPPLKFTDGNFMQGLGVGTSVKGSIKTNQWKSLAKQGAVAGATAPPMLERSLERRVTTLGPLSNKSSIYFV